MHHDIVNICSNLCLPTELEVSQFSLMDLSTFSSVDLSSVDLLFHSFVFYFNGMAVCSFIKTLFILSHFK